ncbi:hypothetical protein SEA_TYPHA_100 [Mycobacterium phage Typha]|uniref:Uncharacterized protein n=1 Tax=Mycobacterium phage Typha TaxID=2517971 RepID=A0A482JAS4_9CAUD|nr:HTH DNA binding protein [Mycobacterium phage Typha]QBP29755.1 hypothetical protein SEA_TYPHA_100 [Mycobacterium phage Typha]
MRCPFCGQFSLTFDLLRLQYTCHVYGSVINVEVMPVGDRSCDPGRHPCTLGV